MNKDIKIWVTFDPSGYIIQNMYVIDESKLDSAELVSFRVATINWTPNEGEDNSEAINRGLNEAVDIVCQNRHADLFQVIRKLIEHNNDSIIEGMNNSKKISKLIKEAEKILYPNRYNSNNSFKES